jgi:hypothetical protein
MSAPWYLAWAVSLPTMLVSLAIVAAILTVVVFTWRVFTGRER